MPEIKSAELFGKFSNPRVDKAACEVEQTLAGEGVEVRRSSTMSKKFQRPEPALDADFDIAIVIGGDGTFMNVARSLAGRGAPLIGVNLGRRGFLTDVSVTEISESFGSILNGQYRIEPRRLVEAVLKSDELDGDEVTHVLNDLVVHKSNMGRLIEFEISVDGDFMTSVRADGIIVATPTGATAYALAAGGPILHPALPAIELIPISPQSLGFRPIVLPETSNVEISMHNVREGQTTMVADGHIQQALRGNEHIVLRSSALTVDLIRIDGHTYFNALRLKLGWGVGPVSGSDSR